MGFVPISASEGQTVEIRGVSTEDAADRVGDETLDIPPCISKRDGDIPILDIRFKFIRKSINIDENAVKFLLVLLKLAETFSALGRP